MAPPINGNFGGVALQAAPANLGAAGPQAAPMTPEYGPTYVIGEFYFAYGLIDGSVLIPVGATTSGRIRITADSDFICYQINAASTQPFTYQIQYQGADRLFSSVPQHSDNATGSGQRPFFLPVPVFLRNNSDLLISFTDLGTAPAPGNRVFMELIGAKVLKTTAHPLRNY